MDAIHDLVAPSGAFRVLPSSGHLTVLRHHQSPSRVGTAGENCIEWSLDRAVARAGDQSVAFAVEEIDAVITGV